MTTTNLWCASTQVRPAPTASKYPAGLKSRFLEGLTGPELKSVMAASTQRHYTAKSVITNQGDPADYFFLLKKGCARYFSVTEEGQRFCFFGSRRERYLEVTHSWRNHRIIC
jgi:hypothetical protein